LLSYTTKVFPSSDHPANSGLHVLIISYVLIQGDKRNGYSREKTE
jgi:hypothetical protein